MYLMNDYRQIADKLISDAEETVFGAIGEAAYELEAQTGIRAEQTESGISISPDEDLIRSEFGSEDSPPSLHLRQTLYDCEQNIYKKIENKLKGRVVSDGR